MIASHSDIVSSETSGVEVRAKMCVAEAGPVDFDALRGSSQGGESGTPRGPIDGECAALRRTRRIEAFDAQHRRAVAQLTAGVPQFEDLCDSFPALLFALSSGYGSDAARRAAGEMIQTGRPLREVAQALGVGLWLRRLPAEAFVSPLPEFPLDQDFGLRIAPLVPDTGIAARIWLDAVSLGWRGCSGEFALWVAGWAGRQQRFVLLPFVERNLHLLAAWAWHADKPETLPHGLMRRRWAVGMGYRRAFDELSVWRLRIDLALALSARRNVPGPLPGRALGYDFVPLLSAEDFVVEAALMDNCLDQFGDRIATRISRVFSIRRDGRSVADVEIGVHDEEMTMPAIRQLRGVRNRRASPEIWQAAYAWLGSQPVRPVLGVDQGSDLARLRSEAKRLWEPYLRAIEPRWTAAGFRDLANGLLRADAQRVARQVRLGGAQPAQRSRRGQPDESPSG